jgi:hypothetical protein
MMLIVKPLKIDVTMNAQYKESMLGLAKEDSRISLVRRLQEIFALRLDAIKFNNETLSGNYIHITKYYGSALFSLSFGLEETSANLYDVKSGKEIVDSYGVLFNILDEIPIRTMRVNVSRHFETEGDLGSYLRSLNPHVPKRFETLLKGRGAFYHLRIPENNLSIFLTIVNSLLVAKGLFLGIEYYFDPYAFNFDDVSGLVTKNDEFILEELELKIKTEA